MATRLGLTQMNAIRVCLGTAAAIAAAFSLLNLYNDLRLLGWAEAIMTVTLSLSLWWSYRDVSLKSIEHVASLQAALFFLLLFFEGGLLHIGYVWMLGFPFIACSMVGSRPGLVYSIVFALVICTCAVGIRFWHIEVYWDWHILPYLAVVYAFFSVIAYLVVLSREHGEEAGRNAEVQLRQEHAALAESEARYKTLLDTLPNAVGVHRHGKWIYVNPAAAKLFAADSADQVVNTPVLDYVHPDHHAMVMERMQLQLETKQAVPVVEEMLVRRNGEVFIAEVQSNPVDFEGELAFMTTCLDISLRKKHEEEKLLLQSQLEHAQRLESLGVLAGGIAHDFNNLLAAIVGNVELARMEAKDAGIVIEHFDNIDDTCDQAAKLSKQMLAYAGKGSYTVGVLNINSTVRSMAKLIRASVGSNVELFVKLDTKLPTIEGDAAQIQQVILNFIVNAADAIGQKPGVIKLTTRAVRAKRRFLDALYNGANLSEGIYTVIEVRDSGCGMDEELQARIFEPFFTTKDTGTGLGLSAVLGIVRAHYGAVQLISKPERGATFRIFLPTTDKPVGTRVVRTVEMEDWNGEGTILVVDDDPGVLTVASALVKVFGFSVLTATDGREGINVFRLHHGKIAAVLLDMTMPHLGGVDAMREMRTIDSSVPVILVSGYSEEATDELVKGEQPDAFVQKPFRAKDLKKCLYKVLHEVDGLT